MWLSRSKAAKEAADESRSPATFMGFTESNPDLYEFRTIEDQYVYLHEMDCVDIHFNPMSRRLDLTFECLASELMQHPLTLTLRFEEAHITQWFDEGSDASSLASSGRPERIRGQVSGLSQVEDAAFSLGLLDLTMTWEACSVACLVHPGSTARRWSPGE